MSLTQGRFLLAAALFVFVVGCGGHDDDNDSPALGDQQFSGDPSRLFVQNLKGAAVDVYLSFGSDSCITESNVRIDGATGECVSVGNGICKFSLAPNERREMNLQLCRADLTFRFNRSGGCDVTKVEANMNVPDWDDTWNISLVDGWNENVRIDVVTSDNRTKTMGPTAGASGNQQIFGVYPHGCDICTARQVPPCGIPTGDSECKTPHGTQNQYKPDVPCQWNHPRANQVTISVVN